MHGICALAKVDLCWEKTIVLVTKVSGTSTLGHVYICIIPKIRSKIGKLLFLMNYVLFSSASM